MAGRGLNSVNDVDHAQFSPDGKLLATASAGGRVQLWNGHDGTPTGVSIGITQLAYRQSAPLNLLFSKNGKILWVGGNTGELTRWDPLTGRSRGAAVKVTSTISMLAVSRAAPLLAIAAGRSIHVYQTDREPIQLLYTQELRSIPVGIAFSPDGRFLVEANMANRVQLRTAADGQPFAAPAMTGSFPRTVEWNSTGRYLVTGAIEGVHRWEAPARATAPHLHRPKLNWKDCAYHLGQRLIAVRDSASQLSVLRIHDGLLVANLGVLPAATNWIEFDPSGEHLMMQLTTGQMGFANLKNQTIQFIDGEPPTWTQLFQVSPQGRYLATIDEKVIQLFDVQAAKRVGKPYLATGEHHPVSFARNDELFSIHDSEAHCLRVFRTSDGLPDGDPLHFGAGYQETSVLHPDGRRALIGMNRTVALWDRFERKLIAKLGTHDAAVGGIFPVPEGRFAISWASDTTVRVWDLESKQQVGRTMRGVGFGPAVRISPDGHLAAFHTIDGGATVWHLRSGRRVLPRIPASAASIKHFDFTDGMRGFFHQDQAEVYPLLPVPEVQEQLTLFVETWTGLTLDEEDVRALTRNEWKKRRDALAATGWKQRDLLPPAEAPIKQESLPPEYKEPIVIESGLENLRRIAYSGDGKRLASCSNKQTKIWDASTLKLAQDFPNQNTASLATCLTRDGKQLLTGGGVGLRWWNVETGAMERAIKPGGTIIDIALSPDEQFVAIVDVNDQKVRVLRRDTGEMLRTLEVPISQPKAQSGKNIESQVSFSPDGKLLVVACGGRVFPDLPGEDSAIAVFEVDSWKLRSAFTADKHFVASLSVSPDSQWIAGACYRGKCVKIWKMPPGTGETLVEWKPTKVVESPHWQHATMFSPSGKLLAHSTGAAVEDGVVVQRLDGEPSITLPTLEGAADLVFSPDGKQLATGSRNGTVSLWDVRDLIGN